MNDDFRLMIGRFVIGSKIVDRQSQMPDINRKIHLTPSPET